MFVAVVIDVVVCVFLPVVLGLVLFVDVGDFVADVVVVIIVLLFVVICCHP